MKTNKWALSCLAISLMLTSCLDSLDKATFSLSEKEDLPPDIVQTEGTNAQVASSTSSIQIGQGGFSLFVPVGAVPQTNLGVDGKVVFSVNVSDEMPAPLPSNLTKGSKVFKVEPFNFNFAYPLTLNVPIQNRNLSASCFSLYFYDESLQEWVKMPYSGMDPVKKELSVNSLQGGYYVIVEDNQALDQERGLGGICVNHPSNEAKKYIYTFTLVSSALKYSEQEKIPNGTIIRTIVDESGMPLDKTFISDFPQGEYSFDVSRELRSGGLASIETASSNLYVKVDKPLIKNANKLNVLSWTNWKVVDMSSLSFSSGRPESWGEPTKTYGTGAFQATLTWVNTYANSTDLDLHLYGPNGMHVYFSDKKDFSFELDRDWTSPPGNATENIYSIKEQLPAGDYRVNVNLYSGSINKEYNIRIIKDGVVVKSFRGVANVSGYNNVVHSFSLVGDPTLEPPLDPNTVNGIPLNMVDIPGGTFTMGSPTTEVNRSEKETQHRVTLSAFKLGKYEVTQALWKAVMGGANPSSFKGDDLPVEMVSWNDVQTFLTKLNLLTGKTYSLPTEAQWEYACRAGTTSPFNTGFCLTDSQANYNWRYAYGSCTNTNTTSPGKTQSVGSYAPNSYGLYDMHGNVWEWCSDWSGTYPTGTQTNPVGPTSGRSRVTRGGSWNINAQFCRSAYRTDDTPTDRDDRVGFRLALCS